MQRFFFFFVCMLILEADPANPAFWEQGWERSKDAACVLHLTHCHELQPWPAGTQHFNVQYFSLDSPSAHVAIEDFTQFMITSGGSWASLQIEGGVGFIIVFSDVDAFVRNTGHLLLSATVCWEGERCYTPLCIRRARDRIWVHIISSK